VTWYSASWLRDQFVNATTFDEILLRSLTMEGKTTNLNTSYYELWDSFQVIFGIVDLSYLPVFEGWVEHVFTDFISENVMHLEARLSPTYCLYDEHGTYPPMFTIQTMKSVLKKTQAQHPHFSFNLIASPMRGTSKTQIDEELHLALDLMEAYPDIVCGVDLVGAEDQGYSLEYLSPLLINLTHEARERHLDLKFFFHAGETNLAGQQNLFDALLLNTTRIGHGFALESHPYLLEQYALHSIAVELCPISNQVLNLLTNLQNHPGLKFLRRNVPVVISSDDPGIFGYSGISPDWWVAFMAWELTLLDMKTLAYNSLLYSVWGSEGERQQATQYWLSAWDTFIHNTLRELGL